MSDWITYDREDLKAAIIKIGIDSYNAGRNWNVTMLPSMIAEKWVYEHLLTDEEKKKLEEFNKETE